MQKTYLFFLQTGMLQGNALNSIGYTDTVLFLTICKLDINQLKSLGKSATVFLAANLPNFFCNTYRAYQYPATVHFPNYQ
jgi:hypothetical protein